MRIGQRMLALLVIAILSALLIGGCGSDTGQNGASGSSVKPAEQTVDPGKTPANGMEGNQVTVYFPTRDAMYLMPESRKILSGREPMRSSIDMLLSGPENRELVAIVPPGTVLRSISVKEHIAYVDFNNAIIKNNPGGSTTELLLVGAIVNTLTEFPDVSGVRILVEGKQVETLTGHADLSGVLGRSEEIIKKQKK